MKSPDFGYYEASSIEDAIKFKSADDESVFLAGGQSLIPALNMRLSTPSCLIDISKINELKKYLLMIILYLLGLPLHIQKFYKIKLY